MFARDDQTNSAGAHVNTRDAIFVVGMKFKRGFDIKLAKEAYVLAAIENDPTFGWTAAT